VIDIAFTNSFRLTDTSLDMTGQVSKSSVLSANLLTRKLGYGTTR